MNLRSTFRWARLLPVAWLLPVTLASQVSAQSGSSKRLQMVGKSTAVQQILVIPVVGSNASYDPANREIEPQFPGVHAEVVEEYIGTTSAGSAAGYWFETSYGNVSLGATVPSCYYQIPQVFADANQDEFVLPTVTAGEWILNGVYEPLDHLVLRYQTVPSEGEKVVDLVFSGESLVSEADALDEVREALIVAGVEDDIEFNLLATDGSVYRQARFNVKESATDVGSYVRVDFVASDQDTRYYLGFTNPTIAQVAADRVVVRSDGALGPPYLSQGATTFDFEFADASEATNSFGWLYDGCAPSCPEWNDEADLREIISIDPEETAGELRVVTVNGRTELEFDMTLGAAFTPTEFRVLGTDEVFVRTMGLGPTRTTIGTGRKDTHRGSPLLTAQALAAFVSTELASDEGCLPTELGNLAVPVPGSATYADDVAAVTAAVDMYLGSFSAIHVLLLSAGNVVRDNANTVTLNASLTGPGGGAMSYEVTTPVAAVEIETDRNTVAHEIGHNLGFPDLYNNSNDDADDPRPSEYHPSLKFPENWDLMAWHSFFEHVSTYTKQSYHGWIQSPGTDNGDVVTLPEGTTDYEVILTPQEYPRALYDDMLPAPTTPVAKMVILPLEATPAGALVPPHYISVEYRNNAAERYGETLYQDSTYVADNIASVNGNGHDAKPISRSWSHPLVIGRGTPFGPSQGSSWFPAYPGLEIEAIETIPGPTPTSQPSARVRITFPTLPKLDLAIEPWRPDLGQYATSAIWFEPATSATPPVGLVPPTDVGNVNPPVYADGYDPVANGGKPLNWIHVAVKNQGNVAARNVQLKLSYNSPGGIGFPPGWTLLEMSERKDIAVNSTVVFSIPWSPDSSIYQDFHTCIAAEVFNWEDENGDQVSDTNAQNNIAQENVHEMIMLGASPWLDKQFQFEVHNGYNRDIGVQLEPQGLLPGYHVEFEDNFFSLAGRASRVINGTLHWDSDVIPFPPNQDPNDPFWLACSAEGPDPVTIEAEDMTHSVGVAVPDGWELSTDGYAYELHEFTGEETRVSVVARGDWAFGWPHMVVAVSEGEGYQVIGDLHVESEQWQAYTFDLPPITGSRYVYIGYDNDLEYGYDRNLILDKVVLGAPRPEHCGHTWGVAGYALIGDYRVPLGGVSFNSVGKPDADLTTEVIVDPNGGVIVFGTVEPPVAEQPVRVVVRYPNGKVDIVTVTTQPDGSFEYPFTPEHWGPISVTTELPSGGPFAPERGEPIEIEACIPDASSCSDGIQNSNETGVDCGGSCVACAPVPNFLWLEAESGSISGSGLSVVSDSGASAGAGVQATVNSLNSPGAGRTTYTFNVAAGTYAVWGRVITPNQSQDSFWVSIDGGPFVRWNEITATGSWAWSRVRNSDNGNALMSYTLSAGTHTLTFANRESGTRLDRIYITTLGDTPSGVGGGNSPSPLWLEAEAGARSGSPLLSIGADSAASGGQYVQSTTNSTSTPGNSRTTFTFNVVAGTYTLWGRVFAANQSADSFWISVDGGSFVRWNEIGAGTTWVWDQVHNSDNGNATVAYPLTTGTHTLVVANREAGTRLDRLYLTPNGNGP